MKVKIGNTEVLCSNNFTINQEMLNTPSVILNNVYPASWEDDKDYTSRFYHPDDYSKCKIYNEIPAEPGVEVTNNPITANVDTSKLYDLKILGNAVQDSTPSPDTPVRIKILTGNNTLIVNNTSYPISFGVKNLFNIETKVAHLLIREDGTTNSSSTVTSSSDYIPVYPSTTYTESFICKYANGVFRVHLYDKDKNWIQQATSYTTTNTSNRQKITFTTGATTHYVRITFRDSTNESQNAKDIMFEVGSTNHNYVEYGKESLELCDINGHSDYIFKNNGTWYKHKVVEKIDLGDTTSINATQTYGSNKRFGIKPTGYTDKIRYFYSSGNNSICDDIEVSYKYTIGQPANATTPVLYCHSSMIYIVMPSSTGVNTSAKMLTWLQTNKPIVYYCLKEAMETDIEITDSNLINELNAIELENGVNTISLTNEANPQLYLHYNFKQESEDILFCGVVKNSGNISLNPRYPHYSTLQILDYKTFLSEGETLDFVIANKTILEAIQQVISTISDYGFELGNVDILNPNDVIGAYSTKDKTAYDVFNYIADITQSRWTTRMVGVGEVAIDFYDPSLMPEGSPIEYNQTWFSNNKIIDMTYNYGTWDYRNKQVMTSKEVLGSISQTQTIFYDGYNSQVLTELPIGNIISILVNGINMSFATTNEKNIGITADFYFTPGNNYFEKNTDITVGSRIVITYLPIVEGRQIINNGVEIERVTEATGVKGVVSRYENRNDATTSLELQKIGQSYIKYKGVPEIKLTIKSQNNLWNIGDRVYFNAPITELDTEYMVKTKKINYIVTADQVFYEFELTSSFNSEQAINYFDNQRAKANGNIAEGEYVSRNVDIENQANIIFYDTEVEEITIDNNNVLQAELETILGG